MDDTHIHNPGIVIVKPVVQSDKASTPPSTLPPPIPIYHNPSPPPIPRTPQMSYQSSPNPSTTQKVDQFGSELEKDAVHATHEFKRKGISVKDSRSS